MANDVSLGEMKSRIDERNSQSSKGIDILILSASLLKVAHHLHVKKFEKTLANFCLDLPRRPGGHLRCKTRRDVSTWARLVEVSEEESSGKYRIAMAKWGEGDPRWIVEDRPDAKNVNNWHW